MHRALRNSITSRSPSLTLAPSSSLTRRPICTNVHIRGIPSDLTESCIYKLVSPYGSIKGLAVYTEHREGPIFHNRPLGQTAIVGFDSTTSAIACKEELHWRPVAVDGSHNIDIRLLDVDARDRPLLSVRFQTNVMRTKVRSFVKRNYDLSWKKIKKWEKDYVHGEIENNLKEEVKESKEMRDNI